VRAAVLTVPTVGTAAVAHAAVDGCDSPFALLVAAGLCWPAAVALLGVQRRLAALLAWVVAAQVGAHLVLAALCADGDGHLGLAASPVMLAAHGVAAVATAALLAGADAGRWTACARLRRATRLLRTRRLPARVVVPAPLRRTSPVSLPLPRTSWVAAQPALRGPPVQAAPAS
jgi:hypothetical protein